MTVVDRRAEAVPAPYQSRVDAWTEEISKYSRTGKGQSKRVTSEWEQKKEIDRLLAQGGQLFFDILKPFKDLDWIKADNPDNPIVDFKSHDPRLRGLDREMFGYFDWGRWVTIHDYSKGTFGRDERATVTFGCSSQGRHGEKVIEMTFNGPIPDTSLGPQLIMRIEDRTESWIDPGKGGVVETVEEKNLRDYSSFDICKLAVSLAKIFAEEQLKRQQAT